MINQVCKLKKSIYGLKQSPKNWNVRFNEFMIAQEFQNSKHDTCLYVKKTNSSVLYVLLYVDDIIIVGNNENCQSEFINTLKSEFEMVTVDNINYLGLIVERNRESSEMKIHQAKYLHE